MRVNAGDIMTEELTIFSSEGRVSGVLDKMNEFSFDIAPIEISGHIRKFVRRKDLEEVSRTDRAIDHAETLEADDPLGTEVSIIDPSPGSQDLLNILYEREKRFAFIVGDGIEGIVTHADLNTVQAGIPLFQLISKYEETACDLIHREVEHDRWVSHFDENEQGDIEEFYQEAKDEDADLRLVDCLNTRQINTVLQEYGLVDRLGLEDDRADDIFNEIEELRNEVMHQRPMVGKHSFNEFVEIVEDLKQVNQNLREEI